MTSGNWFFKLQQEDIKRRLWAIALLMLAFFFALPVGLAVSMENAENTNFFQYNDYVYLLNDGSLTSQAFAAKVLEMKTKVVFKHVAFGNGLTALLVVTAAVVMGAAGFAYLHNRRKVDFYHSLPVSRSRLFAVWFADGILLTAAAYVFNLLLTAAVAVSNGVPFGAFAEAAADGFCMNLLYYSLMYTVTVLAVILTGNMIIALLGVGVLFFFLPGMAILLNACCDTFFVTAGSNFRLENTTFLGKLLCYGSPFAAYMTALSWKTVSLKPYIQVILGEGTAFVLLVVLAWRLFLIRSSEAAGKAMAFKSVMMPIRVLLVLGFGLGGGLFFWMLQSRLRWGLFGVAAAALLAHCVIEIIYHFDFKKLFSHKWQLCLCLAACALLFLSFRFDWYGYDSYMPAREKIASVSLHISRDSRWMNGEYCFTEENSAGGVVKKTDYTSTSEWIEKNMTLKPDDNVMALIEEGVRQSLEERKTKWQRDVCTASYGAKSAASVSIIGGADGPTSVFVAGKTGTAEESHETDSYYTDIKVVYRLTNGKTLRRSYSLYLSNALEAYRAVYNSSAYKEGLYSVLAGKTEDFARISYREAEENRVTVTDKGQMEQLLSAYQADLREQNLDVRLKENPVGELDILSEAALENTKNLVHARAYGWDTEEEDYAYMSGYVNRWPVYPSFSRTIAALKDMGAEPGSFFTAENVEEIEVNGDKDTAELIREPEKIRLLMDGLCDLRLTELNGFHSETLDGDVLIRWKSGKTSYAGILSGGK